MTVLSDVMDALGFSEAPPSHLSCALLSITASIDEGLRSSISEALSAPPSFEPPPAVSDTDACDVVDPNDAMLCKAVLALKVGSSKPCFTAVWTLCTYSPFAANLAVGDCDPAKCNSDQYDVIPLEIMPSLYKRVPSYKHVTSKHVNNTNTYHPSVYKHVPALSWAR